MMFDVAMPEENFVWYNYTGESEMCFGVTLSKFHEIVKNIKKKDTLAFSIYADRQEILEVKVIPSSRTRVSISTILIRKMQFVENELPELDTSVRAVIMSSEYQKMCKEILKMSDVVNVRTKPGYIRFSCNCDNLVYKAVEFGAEDYEDAGDDDSEEIDEVNVDFNTEQFSRITKIANLGQQIQIYTGELIKMVTNIESIGSLTVFVKSSSHIAQDEENNRTSSSVE